ncbi:MAG: DUF4272 domain-containing protein [Pirellula sp.]
MLAGYPSVAEELPMGGHNDPMGRSGGSADTEHKETKMSDEAQTRKDRSITILKAEKVPFIEHLPPIETEADSTRRTTEQVANRAMALCIVAVKGEGLEQEFIDKLIEKYALASAFTPEEKEFISNPKPTQHDRVQFAWRYECFWVMLWALGYIDELGRPDTICDVKRAVSILRVNGRDGFLKNAKLRPQSELLDAADLIYRYHWAVVDARVNQRDAPAGLDGGIVMERHHALNWLIGYMDQDWDDVSTDT